MDSNGTLCVLFVLNSPYGSSWVLMQLYASLCILIGFYRFLFVLMDTNGSLWVLIGLYASLWVLLGF